MNKKITKKLTAIGISSMLFCGMLGNPEALKSITDPISITAVAATASGTCGSGLRWSIDGDTLTISGTGTEMQNYSSKNKTPWISYSSQIKKVILPNTLKSIGNYAFYSMEALEYVYTLADYGQFPCMPDVDVIGNYAFANCYAFRGNTQNGILTLGLGDFADGSTSKLTVGKRAFQNCDHVRLLKCNYDSMKVEELGFHNMDMLSSVYCGDTTMELGSRAFYNDQNLSKVEYKPSVLTINNTAFYNTLYYKNSFTGTDYNRRNLGAASKMKGKSLVVNFFVDQVQLDLSNPIYTVEQTDVEGQHAIRLAGDEIATPKPVGPTSESCYTGIYKKDDLYYKHIFSWEAEKQDSPTENSVIALNKLDFNDTDKIPDQNYIPHNTYETESTNGYLGSYVSSQMITERLTQLREAFDDLETQSAQYGDKCSFEMNPDTNFYITLNNFDWSETQATVKPRNAPDTFLTNCDYMLTKGYNGGNGAFKQFSQSQLYYSDGQTGISDSSYEKLFNAISEASQQLTGYGTYPIDMKMYSGTFCSDYTRYLKEKYHVDNIVYLVHVTSNSQSCAYPTKYNDDRDRIDEFAIICGGKDIQNTIEHETSHLFGALDYYKRGRGVSKEAGSYIDTYLDPDGELMICNGIKVSPVTAFSIGWLDKLDTPTYNMFFDSDNFKRQ
ncbi:MAG: leucine-rich repeat protein [Ruminococcus sp.]|uniref:leucine-rich repeat domain-containing protein n=1 Tax=Ruminococcus sp. TaxID=41978 RepID=UPI0025F4F0CF|nr:leucine-rich repeat protein [Ruminococcus sp.]MCR5601276.1 leucine-rich repeat protein [Ruminococcus sp.]